MSEYDKFDLRPPSKRKRHDADAEWRLQAKCAKIARQLRRADRLFEFEFLNTEGHKTPQRAGMWKMMGGEAGTLEVRLYYKGPKHFRVAAGDCKRKDGRISPAQQKWIDYYAGTPIKTFIIHSTDEFWGMINWVRGNA